MAFLSQASHFGSLLLPHDAFQEHAAHPAEWSAELNSKGSERTCIRSGLATFLHYACTAHSDLVVDSWPPLVRAAQPLIFQQAALARPKGVQPVVSNHRLSAAFSFSRRLSPPKPFAPTSCQLVVVQYIIIFS